MVITEIKKGKKSSVYLYVDGQYFISLKDEIFVKSGIKIGDRVDENTLYSLRKESQAYRAKEKAFNLLSYRNRSRDELKKRLEREVEESAAELAVDKMESLGLIDDKAFTQEYAKQLLFNKHLSVSFAKYKLKTKGVSDDIIEEVLESFSVDEEKQVLYLLTNKFSGKMQSEKETQKVISSIKRLGYSWGTIKSAISLYNEGIVEDELI